MIGTMPNNIGDSCVGSERLTAVTDYAEQKGASARDAEASHRSILWVPLRIQRPLDCKDLSGSLRLQLPLPIDKRPGPREPLLDPVCLASGFAVEFNSASLPAEGCRS